MNIKTKRLKCAVIGVGNIGKHHARNFFEMEDANLVAVCDRNTGIGKKIAKEYKCRFYKNYNDMLHKEEIDVVSIATPVSTHYAIARDCIKARKNILIEKPIVLTLSEGNKLLRILKKSDLLATVGHIERFNPAVKKLKQMIIKGQLGDIKSLIFQRVGLVPSKDRNVNVVLDVGIHDIDLANFFLSTTPKEIIASGGRALINYQEDFADVLLIYGKTNVHLQTNWITPLKIRRLMVAGTKGYAELNFISQTLDFYRNNYGEKYRSFRDFVLKFGGLPKKNIIRVVKKEPLKEELESFLKDVRFGRKPMVTIEDSLIALQIALKVSKMINEKTKYKNSSKR